MEETDKKTPEVPKGKGEAETKAEGETQPIQTSSKIEVKANVKEKFLEEANDTEETLALKKQANFKLDFSRITNRNVDCLKLLVEKTFPLSYSLGLYDQIVYEYYDYSFFGKKMAKKMKKSKRLIKFSILEKIHFARSIHYLRYFSFNKE